MYLDYNFFNPKESYIKINKNKNKVYIQTHFSSHKITIK